MAGECVPSSLSVLQHHMLHVSLSGTLRYPLQVTPSLGGRRPAAAALRNRAAVQLLRPLSRVKPAEIMSLGRMTPCGARHVRFFVPPGLSPASCWQDEAIAEISGTPYGLAPNISRHGAGRRAWRSVV
jgi:hypothetical protein